MHDFDEDFLDIYKLKKVEIILRKEIKYLDSFCVIKYNDGFCVTFMVNAQYFMLNDLKDINISQSINFFFFYKIDYKMNENRNVKWLWRFSTGF